MKKQDFYFELPPELIAQYPTAKRSDSRLLTYQRATASYAHHQFKDLADFLQPGDLLVMNNSEVISARLFGQKSSGGKVELLVERILSPQICLAHIKASKALRPGAVIFLDKGYTLEVVERQDDLFLCRAASDISELLQQIGHMPLPPYISRTDEMLDKTRYQTVYAKHAGSVAAPTAGLHFDESLLASLAAKGIKRAYLTLHVGAGTFRPVRSESIFDHKMHSERYTISQDLCDQVMETRARGQRVIAVGTTALRALESAAALGPLCPHEAETEIFIYPGYQFKLCNGLITNFHLPESTLLMLVSAFIGYQQARALYAEAIAKRYRFFSYGDSSLLL